MNNITMDRALKRVSIAASVLIVILMINLNYLQGSQADKYGNDSKNPRKYAGVANRHRGEILAGGTVLAESYKPDPNGKKYQRKYDVNPTQAFYPITGVYMTNGSKYGLERAYDSMLDGVDKRLTVKGWFDQLTGKQPAGANVVTTIDPKTQLKAYQLLKDSTSRRAGAVVLDIKTGAIKVMASTPSVDPNSLSGGTDSPKAIDAFNKASKGFNSTVDKAMSDRVFPGSSFKIVMSAAGIESGRYNKDSTVDTKDLKLPESGKTLPNDPGQACSGQQTSLLLAFANSCNSTYGQMALDLGPGPIEDMAKKFGFEQPTIVEPDMPSVASTLTAGGHTQALKPHSDALARTGIGQESTGASPLQMAMVAEAVANNGTMMKPYLVDKVVGPDGTDLYDVNQQAAGNPIKPDTASQLQDMMRAVVDQGTGTSLKQYNMAGKTGTAETGIGNGTCGVSGIGGGINDRWFVGFYPANSPKYAFAVMTEGCGFGADKAGPIAGQIMQTLDGK